MATIQAKASNGERVEVEGVLVDFLGVHVSLHNQGENRPAGPSYVITHSASGCLVPGLAPFYRLPSALDCAREIVARCPELACDEPNTLPMETRRELLDRLRPIWSTFSDHPPQHDHVGYETQYMCADSQIETFDDLIVDLEHILWDSLVEGIGRSAAEDKWIEVTAAVSKQLESAVEALDLHLDGVVDEKVQEGIDYRLEEIKSGLASHVAYAVQDKVNDMASEVYEAAHDAVTYYEE